MHIGHLSFALKALDACRLDRIILLPERYPRGKQRVADFDARIKYIEELTRAFSQIEVTILKSMPITLESEKRELSHIFQKNNVVLLMGSDTIQSLNQWQDINLVLKDHELCVGIRGNDSTETVDKCIATLEQEFEISIIYHTVTTPHKDVSSTMIRASTDYEPL